MKKFILILMTMLILPMSKTFALDKWLKKQYATIQEKLKDPKKLAEEKQKQRIANYEKTRTQELQRIESEAERTAKIKAEAIAPEAPRSIITDVPVAPPLEPIAQPFKTAPKEIAPRIGKPNPYAAVPTAPPLEVPSAPAMETTLKPTGARSELLEGIKKGTQLRKTASTSAPVSKPAGTASFADLMAERRIKLHREALPQSELSSPAPKTGPRLFKAPSGPARLESIPSISSVPVSETIIPNSPVPNASVPSALVPSTKLPQPSSGELLSEIKGTTLKPVSLTATSVPTASVTSSVPTAPALTAPVPSAKLVQPSRGNLLSEIKGATLKPVSSTTVAAKSSGVRGLLSRIKLPAHLQPQASSSSSELATAAAQKEQLASQLANLQAQQEQLALKQQLEAVSSQAQALESQVTQSMQKAITSEIAQNAESAKAAELAKQMELKNLELEKARLAEAQRERMQMLNKIKPSIQTKLKAWAQRARERVASGQKFVRK